MQAWKTRLLAAAAAAIVCAGAAAAGSARAQGVNYCVTAAADASITLPLGDYQERYSPDTSYAQKNGCKEYIVDVSVPSLPQGQSGTFWLWSNPVGATSTKGSCEATTLVTSLYRRTLLDVFNGNGFSLVGYGRWVGSWDAANGQCTLDRIQGNLPGIYSGQFPLLGATTYRLTVSATLQTGYGPFPLKVMVAAHSF
jgi:hypothetical protein